MEEERHVELKHTQRSVLLDGRGDLSSWPKEGEADGLEIVLCHSKECCEINFLVPKELKVLPELQVVEELLQLVSPRSIWLRGWKEILQCRRSCANIALWWIVHQTG